MFAYLNTPVFGVLLSIITFIIGANINKKLKTAILNPLLLSAIIIIAVLVYFDIDYDIYNKGGSIISFFVAPATIILAVPLYKNIKQLGRSWFAILIGIAIGSFAGLITTLLLARFFKIDRLTIVSMLPKSTTAAISMDIASQIGGVPILAIAFTAVAGIGGNAIGEYILKIFRVNTKVAKGVALGTASHALGTAKAMEIGETEGAMASLSIGLAGIISVFLIPWFMSTFLV